MRNPDLDRQRERLRALGALLQEAHELRFAELPLPDEVPVAALGVELAPDHADRARSVSLMLLPFDPAIMPHAELLQLFHETPVVVPAERQADVARFLSPVNLKSPVGTFALQADGRLVCRHVLVLERGGPPAPPSFAEAFVLWMYTLDALAQLVEAVAVAGLPVDEAIELLAREGEDADD